MSNVERWLDPPDLPILFSAAKLSQDSKMLPKRRFHFSYCANLQLEPDYACTQFILLFRSVLNLNTQNNGHVLLPAGCLSEDFMGPSLMHGIPGRRCIEHLLACLALG
jgi:hypothetical protein